MVSFVGTRSEKFFEQASDLAGFEAITLLIEDDVAFFTWKTDAVAFGIDTFVVRDGKMAVQTVAMPAS